MSFENDVLVLRKYPGPTASPTLPEQAGGF